MTIKKVSKEEHNRLHENLRKAVQDIRDIGYAVVYWNTDELGEVDPYDVEGLCVEVGNKVISRLSFNISDPSNEAPF